MRVINQVTIVVWHTIPIKVLVTLLTKSNDPPRRGPKILPILLWGVPHFGYSTQKNILGPLILQAELIAGRGSSPCPTSRTTNSSLPLWPQSHMCSSLNEGPFFIRVPCYIGDPKRDPNLENHPYHLGIW